MRYLALSFSLCISLVSSLPYLVSVCTIFCFCVGAAYHVPACLTHKPNVHTQLPEPSNAVSNSSIPVPKKQIFTPMKPSKKRKGRVSDTFDLKQVTVDKCAAINSTSPRIAEGAASSSQAVVEAYQPVSCWWSNNSCAYNVTVYILYNTWHIVSQDYKNMLHDFENPWLNMLVTSFMRHWMDSTPWKKSEITSGDTLIESSLPPLYLVLRRVQKQLCWNGAVGLLHLTPFIIHAEMDTTSYSQPRWGAYWSLEVATHNPFNSLLKNANRDPSPYLWHPVACAIPT